MKTLQIVLLIVIVIGLGLLVSQRYWVPRLVDFIIKQEESRSTDLLGGDRDEHGCIGSAGYNWCESRQKCLRAWEEPCEGQEINFDENGHLAKDNPGMKPGAWFLVYEEPGAPALTAELLFDEGSFCSVGGVRGQCPDSLLVLSSLIRVQGVMQDGVVKVISAGN